MQARSLSAAQPELQSLSDGTTGWDTALGPARFTGGLGMLCLAVGGGVELGKDWHGFSGRCLSVVKGSTQWVPLGRHSTSGGRSRGRVGLAGLPTGSQGWASRAVGVGA